MKALKALVIGMGVLIVIGIALIGYGLIRGKQAPQMQEITIETHEPYAASVPVPPGWKLEQVIPDGDRIVLRFSSADGDRLAVYNAKTGLPVGAFTLVPGSH